MAVARLIQTETAALLAVALAGSTIPPNWKTYAADFSPLRVAGQFLGIRKITRVYAAPLEAIGPDILERSLDMLADTGDGEEPI